jgi:carbonic anhydrase
VFPEQQELFSKLSTGQNPSALFITCADSRINPNLLTQTEPGELFILRNAGNMVPPYGAVQGGESATVEYALSVLNVQDIIVCGHSHCGAVNALLDPKSVDSLPAVKQWLAHAETTRRIIRENYAELNDREKLLNVAIQEHVLVQLENLQTHPSVAAKLSRSQLTLHAWVYKFETGDVFAFNPASGRFESLGRHAKRRVMDDSFARDPRPEVVA